MDSGITIVIPVYNGAVHLAETISSALAQTLRPSSIIVVDDGSSDGTSQVALQFGGEVRCIRQDHAGISKARNTGVAHTETDYLAFMDGDDLWASDKLALQMAELQRAAGPAMIFGHTTQFASPELSPEEIAALKFDPNPMPAITASALLMRKSDFLIAGSFDETLQTGEFIEWYARARDRGLASLVLSDVLVRRRLHRHNHGRRRVDARADYARALKSVLDRRRKVD